MTTWEQRLNEVEGAVQGWVSRLPNPDLPEPGSSLSRDDQTLPGMPVSQLAWYGMSVSVEHLHATLNLLQTQTGGDNAQFPTANYTVLRAAALGASQAAVLLAPKSRHDRTTYGLRIAHEEFVQSIALRTDVLAGAQGLDPELLEREKSVLSRWQQRLEGIEAQLQSRGVGKKRYKLTDTALIRIAAEIVHSDDDYSNLLQQDATTQWSLGSGASHGRLLIAMHRPGGYKQKSGKGLFVGNRDYVIQRCCSVSLMLSEAWRLWDLQRKNEC